MSGNSMAVMSSSKSDEWYTPVWLMDRLREEFNFTLDAAACKTSHIVDRYYSIDNDGLSKDWTGETVFCNPPYSNISKWVQKFSETDGVVVALVPVRAGTGYWSKYVYPYAKEILIFRGRIKFENSPYSAPFDACLLLYGTGQETLKGLSDLGTVLTAEETQRWTFSASTNN